MSPLPRLVLALSVLLALVAGEYDAKSHVEVLTDKNFEQQVLQSDDYWLVEFYAPWCGHCQKLEPEWKKAAKKLRGKARLGAIDATVHTKLAQKYGIQGYPTIKEFDANKKKPTDYQGGRTKQDIVNYVLNSDVARKLGVSSNSVTRLDFNGVHAFLSQQPAVPTAIFFGSTQDNNAKAKGKTKNKKAKAPGASKPPKWLHKLANEFVGEPKAKKSTKNNKKKASPPTPSVRFGFVPSTEAKIAKHLHLTDESLPTMVLVYPSENTFETLDTSKIKQLDAKTANQFIKQALESSPESRSELPKLPLFPSPGAPKKKPQFSVRRFESKHVTACTTKSSRKKMCVVVAQQPQEEQQDHPQGQQETALKSLAKKYRRDPFAFYQSLSTDESFGQLQSVLQLPPAKDQASYRVVIVKAGRKLKYVDTSIDNLDQFESTLGQVLDKVLEGTASFITFEEPQQDQPQDDDKSERQRRQQEQDEQEQRLAREDQTEEELHEEL